MVDATQRQRRTDGLPDTCAVTDMLKQQRAPGGQRRVLRYRLTQARGGGKQEGFCYIVSS